MSRILIKSKVNTVLLEEVLYAETLRERMRGLLGHQDLPPKTGMWLRPCRSIHMWFMRFPIDAAFLDADQRVLKIARNLKPWQLAFAPAGTCSVIETRAGELAPIRAGDLLAEA
jgi:uncharacterized membrane protein (UPF0127 family)